MAYQPKSYRKFLNSQLSKGQASGTTMENYVESCVENQKIIVTNTASTDSSLGIQDGPIFYDEVTYPNTDTK